MIEKKLISEEKEYWNIYEKLSKTEKISLANWVRLAMHEKATKYKTAKEIFSKEEEKS